MKIKLLRNPIQLTKNYFNPKRKIPLKKRLLRYLGLFSISVLTLVILLFAWYSKDLPTPGKIKSHRQTASTQLLDRNGKQLYSVSGDERRILISSEEFQDEAFDNLKNATIAVEDRDFYRHRGFNVRSVFRALYKDVKTGSAAQGGSTITQQYVKNALLSPEKNITRKIKELILAIEIEFMFSKDEILAFYLNEIPYGGNVYGAEAAANRYFGVAARDLTLAQSATLAGMPQRPTYFSPYGSNLEALINRKNLILNLMADQGYISKEEAEEAKTQPPLTRADFTDPKESITAPHFVFYAQERLVEILGGDSLAERLVYEGGLTVTTSLDLEYQALADQAVKDASQLTRINANNAALVAADPQKGEILAMVGSRDYFDKENQGNFNAAATKRQPGSSIKPIFYAAALKKGYAPSTVLFDLPTNFSGYEPKNYDGGFRGPITIRRALGNSLNIPAVKALALVGMDEGLQTARNLGINTFTDKDRYGLALALGGAEVRLTEMVAAYGVFANEGKLMPQTAILKVEDSDGKVLYDSERDRKVKNAIEPEVAYQISHILADVDAKRPIFGNSMGVLTLRNQTVASKTGTTNDIRDAWTMGYTPNLVAGVWVGNNDNSPIRGGGSMAAAPIWHSFISKAAAMRPKEDFKRPSTISDFTVEYYSGKKPTQFSQKTVTDIFAPWQIPKDNEDVNVMRRVCRENGLLATDSTPNSVVEERVFSTIRSKKPNDPAWENPVRGWAQNNGFNNPLPTQTCDIKAERPSVSITSPTQGASVNGNFLIRAEGSAVFQIQTVEVFIDGVSVKQGNTLPYEFTYNASNLSKGAHTVTARVTDINGSTGEASAIFEVVNDTTPPGLATGVSLTLSGGNINVSWTNPSDSDFSTMNIYVSPTSGVLGTKNSTKSGTPSSGGSTSISGLTGGKTYYVTLRAQDASGNENTNLNQLAIALP